MRAWSLGESRWPFEGVSQAELRAAPFQARDEAVMTPVRPSRQRILGLLPLFSVLVGCGHGAALEPADAAAGRGPRVDCYKESAEQLFRALDGEPVDRSRICLGDDSPARLLGSDGSQNWPVAAQAAVYVESGDGSWFDRYLGIQITGEIGFMGKELLSYAYGPAIVGPIMVVLKEAEQRNHA